MIFFTTNEKEYACLAEWREITLAKAIEASKYVHSNIPPLLKKSVQSECAMYMDGALELKDAWKKDIDAISEEEHLKLIPIYAAGLLSILSLCPKEIIGHIDKKHLTGFYFGYLHKLAMGLLHFPFDHHYEEVESITIADTTCWLPSIVDYGLEKRPMADRTAIEFTEVADLELNAKKLEGGNIEVLPLVIAIMCRPRGVDGMIEKYNELICAQRSKLFLDLNMDDVWNVFFSLKNRCTLLEQNTAICLLKEKHQAMEEYVATSQLGGLVN
jgi:hypothetical protein